LRSAASGTEGELAFDGTSATVAIAWHINKLQQTADSVKSAGCRKTVASPDWK
jgi:hypothetical protein